MRSEVNQGQKEVRQKDKMVAEVGGHQQLLVKASFFSIDCQLNRGLS